MLHFFSLLDGIMLTVFPHFRSVEWQINNIFIAARKRYLFFWAIFQGKLFLFFFLFISFSFLSLGQDNVNKIPLMVTVYFTAVHKTNDPLFFSKVTKIYNYSNFLRRKIHLFLLFPLCLSQLFYPLFLSLSFLHLFMFFPSLSRSWTGCCRS